MTLVRAHDTYYFLGSACYSWRKYKQSQVPAWYYPSQNFVRRCFHSEAYPPHHDTRQRTWKCRLYPGTRHDLYGIETRVATTLVTSILHGQRKSLQTSQIITFTQSVDDSTRHLGSWALKSYVHRSGLTVSGSVAQWDSMLCLPWTLPGKSLGKLEKRDLPGANHECK